MTFQIYCVHMGISNLTFSFKGINQEDIQPGNMKVWSDPFKKKDEH